MAYPFKKKKKTISIGSMFSVYSLLSFFFISKGFSYVGLLYFFLLFSLNIITVVCWSSATMAKRLVEREEMYGFWVAITTLQQVLRLCLAL